MDHSIRGLLTKVRRVRRDQGVKEILRRGFQLIHINLRPYLPSTSYPEANGVTVASERYKYTVFDKYAPWKIPSLPEKKESAMSIQKYVNEGEKVVVIGGGYGISTVIAARKVSADGKVVTYEGSKSRFRILAKTIDLNDVTNVSLKHAIVGPEINLAGEPGVANTVDPAELEDLDVLEMDCEGAEISILESLEYNPRLMIIETHPENGAATGDVKNLLRNNGYKIIEENPDPGAGHILVAENCR